MSHGIGHTNIWSGYPAGAPPFANTKSGLFTAADVDWPGLSVDYAGNVPFSFGTWFKTSATGGIPGLGYKVSQFGVFCQVTTGLNGKIEYLLA